MRQINQPREPHFLPDLLPLQILRIETQEVCDLRFLQCSRKVPFSAPSLGRLDSIQFLFN